MVTDTEFLSDSDTTNHDSIIGQESADLLEELYSKK